MSISVDVALQRGNKASGTGMGYKGLLRSKRNLRSIRGNISNLRSIRRMISNLLRLDNHGVSKSGLLGNDNLGRGDNGLSSGIVGDIQSSLVNRVLDDHLGSLGAMHNRLSYSGFGQHGLGGHSFIISFANN